jgi:hypothetical protein
MSPDAEFTDGDPSTGATQPSSLSPFSQPPSSARPALSASSSFPSPQPTPAPRLPDGMGDGPTIVGRPTGQPVIPRVEATAPTDPPPSLISTWWLRIAILLMMLGALVLTVWVEYTGEADDIGSHLLVIGLHIVIAGSIVLWSFAAVLNANKLVPPSLYQRHANPLLAAVLWLGAFAAPFAAVKAFTLVDEQSAAQAGLVAEPSSEPANILALAVVVLVGFVLVWLPFRYHARQALRIGAPRGVMLGWFFAPLLALVGGIAILALGLHDQLALDGLTVTERTIQVVLVYGLPMLMFTLTTWRAITVFDEVIDLKWRRWKIVWEQTLGGPVRQPAPVQDG